MSVRKQNPPLQVVRSFELEGGGALVHLHNLSGGVLGGDRLELEVNVQPHARAQLTTPSATRIYKQREGYPDAVQVNDYRIAEGGLLENLPDPIIPYAHSRYRQETRIDLSPGAGFIGWETVAPGREARSECFDYDLLDLRMEILTGGHPLLLEKMKLEPLLRPLSSRLRLGEFRYFTTLYLCRVDWEGDWLTLESRLSGLAQDYTRPGDCLWGVSALPTHGLTVRAVSRTGRELAPGLLAFWQAAKREIYGEVAVMPRKIY